MDKSVSASVTNAHIFPVQGYVTCGRCGSILGYKTTINGQRLYHLYAYPADGPRGNLAERRVNGRFVSGDVYCPKCAEWKKLKPLG